jgi:hypothetical protein
VEKGRVFLLAPLSLFSIGPLISRKQAAYNAADRDGNGDKNRDPEVATGHSWSLLAGVWAQPAMFPTASSYFGIGGSPICLSGWGVALHSAKTTA